MVKSINWLFIKLNWLIDSCLFNERYTHQMILSLKRNASKNINVELNQLLICNLQSLKILKGTLMPIWTFCNTFAFIQKIAPRRLRIITPFTFWDMSTNIQKQQSTLKSSLLFKKKYKRYGQITQEFLGIRMRSFQGIIFIWT